MAQVSTPDPDDRRAELELSPQIIEQFRDMASMIPLADTTGGQERLIGAILGAGSQDELDKPWNERGFPLGVWVKVVGVEAAPSDFTGGLPFYLIADCIDLETGESVKYTTGGVSATCQLTAAFAKGLLPWTCKLVRAEKASANGFYPEHLQGLRNDDQRGGKARRG
jgi:hypothetical protein